MRIGQLDDGSILLKITRMDNVKLQQDLDELEDAMRKDYVILTKGEVSYEDSLAAEVEFLLRRFRHTLSVVVT